MTVVGLHGFAGAPPQWQGLVDEAPWIPGHGPQPPDRDWSTTVAVLAAAVAPGSLLIGYSLGARLALAIALTAPDRVGRLVLVGGTPGIDDPEERGRRQVWDDAQAEAIERDLSSWLRAWEQLPVFAGQSSKLVAEQRTARAGHDPAGLAWAMRALGQGRMPSLWADLHRCPPLHLVVGARDDKYVRTAQRMAELVPEAALTVVPDVGHNVLLEAPHALRQVMDGQLDGGGLPPAG